MKFADIRAELVKKEKIIENTKNNIEFSINKLTQELHSMEENLIQIQNMIMGFDNISSDAE